MSDCLFCKMVEKEISPDIVYENEQVLAFRDINPQAPVHILVIPKQHISTLNDCDQPELMATLLQTVIKVAKQEGVEESGYRTVINCNKDGGQEVGHLHIHLLAKRQMQWPPG
ncbi:MAG: histidine triad nucleotide-binding protein [Methyloprofundus sp.]|nr:histidine triad nucleotide-binding protein [Methyloprofundus sp.]